MSKYRCPQCRTRRATFVGILDHIEKSGHELCGCGGYHYPHRPNSPLCDRNGMATYNRAVKAGATEEELLDISIDMIIETMNLIWVKPKKLLTSWPE